MGQTEEYIWISIKVLLVSRRVPNRVSSVLLQPLWSLEACHRLPLQACGAVGTPQHLICAFIGAGYPRKHLEAPGKRMHSSGLLAGTLWEVFYPQARPDGQWRLRLSGVGADGASCPFNGASASMAGAIAIREGRLCQLESVTGCPG